MAIENILTNDEYWETSRYSRAKDEDPDRAYDEEQAALLEDLCQELEDREHAG